MSLTYRCFSVLEKKKTECLKSSANLLKDAWIVYYDVDRLSLFGRAPIYETYSIKH